tara:strand:- start:6084 stop:6287 length:204 start_codon:yes stop_codon:yes gene_type:complete
MMNIPKQFYEQEGFMTVAGLGYTTALATSGLGLVMLLTKRDYVSVVIVAGGALSTFGFLKQAGILGY